MSVHTHITTIELAEFLKKYSLGELENYTGIADGITNTIYRLQTTESQYILTLFENLTTEELPFFVNYMQYLQHKGYPCPQIMPMKNGETITELANRPAIIASYLTGEMVKEPSLSQAKIVGAALGQLHLLSEECNLQQKNYYDFSWHIALADQVTASLTEEQQQLLAEEIEWQQQQDYSQLPEGLCHMDLFPDNVLFENEELTGVLDFYYACHNYYLLDLATTMCAWSLTNDGINKTLGENVVVQYQMQRPLTKQELPHLKNMQRYAALHFWLTRLRDKYLVPAQEGVLVKDPNQFEALLRSIR